MTTALLVIDVQNAVVANAHDRDGVIARLVTLVGRARRSGCPVIWVRHSDEELVPGTPGWNLVDGLAPSEDEPVIEKNFGDSFEGTSLGQALAERNISRIYVSGAQTDFCIRSTLHGAVTRGYDAILVSDCHTTDDKSLGSFSMAARDVIAHTNFYWKWHRTASNVGGAIESDEIKFD